jgi:predicted neuraminidase
MVGGIGELVTEQYVLRSTDAGVTWRVYPCPSPAGSLPSRVALKYPRVEEANFVNLVDGRIGTSLRTIEGHVWWTESNDDGLSWSPARSTGLAHPSAPAPVRRLSDGRLMILTHNNSHDDRAMWVQSRDKLWITFSDDEGQTWGAPRFLWGTPTPERLNGACYPDMIQDGDELHILVSHHWHDLLYLRLKLDALDALPTAPPEQS